MKKEVFRSVLKFVATEFPHIDAGYRKTLESLSDDEKANLDNFEPYVKNREFHRLDIDERSLKIKTVSSGTSLTLRVNELPFDWIEHKKNRNIVDYFEVNDNSLYHVAVKLKDSKDGWYLEEEYSLWDSELGDYQYIGRNQSRELGYYEIKYAFTDQTKLNKENEI